jgi:hypothetical protein
MTSLSSTARAEDKKGTWFKIVIVVIWAFSVLLSSSMYAAFGQTGSATTTAVALSNTFDSKLHGVRLHYPAGWVVEEAKDKEGFITTGPPGSPPPVTFEAFVLSVCPFSQVEERPLLRNAYDLAKTQEGMSRVFGALCGGLPDGYFVTVQSNLNSSVYQTVVAVIAALQPIQALQQAATVQITY